MLKVGDQIPDFSLRASNGEELNRDDLNGAPAVVFFYPKSFTRGCTIETREFARLAPEIEALGARVVGVSIDDFETQCDFAKDTGADFPILADEDGEVSRAFGVRRFLLPVARRATFIVDEDGIVEAAFAMELKFSQHVDRVVEHLKARSSG